MSATLREIAVASQTSVSTVSKVLRGNGKTNRISSKKIELIKQTASVLGYTPNINAKALVSRCGMAVGVYIGPASGPKISETYVSPILEGISMCASENSYDVMLIDLGLSTLKTCIDKIEQKRIDGLIVIHADSSDPMLENLQKKRQPVVAINYHKNSQVPLCSVNLDNFAGIELIMDYLISLGHTNIAYIGELNESICHDHLIRSSAFERISRERHLKNCNIVEYPVINKSNDRRGSYCHRDGYDGMDWLLENFPQKHTAVICYNDLAALGAISRLTKENIHIPDEISVTGFDNSFISEHATPHLTSVSHPMQSMGYQATQLLLDQLQKPKDDFCKRTVMFQPELILRSSCGPALKRGE